MPLPDPTLAWFQTRVPELLNPLLEAWQTAAPRGDGSNEAPPLLADAFGQLLEAMVRTEASLAAEDGAAGASRATPEDITELGEYAFNLFNATLAWAQRLNLDEVIDGMQELSIALALWIARHGGYLYTAEPVADALALYANRTREPSGLAALYEVMGEVLAAIAPALRQDLEKTNPGRPWRVLNLNRAIVATRTHRPELMEQAFAVLIENLPEDAPQFFSQGMEQMDLLNYPSHVREVMDKYYQQWSVKRSLH